MAILEKIQKIRAGLNIEKTGYDERNDYAFFRAEDVARGVRNAMVENGVIHRTEILEFNEDNFYDQNGRNRPRITVKGRVTFIDTEDGSEFWTDAIGTGSDTGGDKAARKYAVQLFKVATIDLFTIVEDMGKFDSDGEKEAEPVNVAAPAERSLNASELKAKIGAIVKDSSNAYTGADVNKIGTRIAKAQGASDKPADWQRLDSVMSEVLKALENGEVE